MPADALPTVADVVTRVRLKLDEPLDAASNFWTDDELLAYLNEGCREVWQQARETNENYFVKTIRSSDAPFASYGHSYDPSLLRLVSGRATFLLPPDFAALLYFEPVTAADGTDTGIVFEFADMTKEVHRVLSRAQGPTTGGHYAYDIEFRDEGPLVKLAPQVALATAVETELRYVRGIRPLAATDSFDGTCFNHLMIDAVCAYMEYEAHRKEKVAGNIAVAQGRWAEKAQLITRASGPRTFDLEVVDGFLENELD